MKFNRDIKKWLRSLSPEELEELIQRVTWEYNLLQSYVDFLDLKISPPNEQINDGLPMISKLLELTFKVDPEVLSIDWKTIKERSFQERQRMKHLLYSKETILRSLKSYRGPRQKFETLLNEIQKHFP